MQTTEFLPGNEGQTLPPTTLLLSDVHHAPRLQGGLVILYSYTKENKVKIKGCVVFVINVGSGLR